MRKHSKYKKGQAQKDTKHMTLLKRNQMQRNKTSSRGSRKELESIKVSSLSSILIVVE
jgi:hypothetical protein